MRCALHAVKIAGRAALPKATLCCLRMMKKRWVGIRLLTACYRGPNREGISIFKRGGVALCRLQINTVQQHEMCHLPGNLEIIQDLKSSGGSWDLYLGGVINGFRG